MNLNYLADKIRYCALHLDCLDEYKQSFVQDLQVKQKREGDSFFVTKNQSSLLHWCLELILAKHPLPPRSKLEEMKWKAQRQERTRIARDKKYRRLTVGMSETATVSITAKARRGKTRAMRTTDFIGTLRDQKPG